MAMMARYSDDGLDLIHQFLLDATDAVRDHLTRRDRAAPGGRPQADFLNTVLGFYANCGIAWVVVVASDITINKYLLEISPKQPEFRRGMLYAINPVGFGSMLVAAGVSILVFSGGLGETIRPYSPLVAIGRALVLPLVLAIATRGRWYLRRTDDGIDSPMADDLGNPSAETLTCHVCRQDFERPDMAACQTHGAHVCSLCLSTDRTGEQVLPEQPTTARLGPDRSAQRN